MAQHYEVVGISSEEGLLKTFKLFQKNNRMLDRIVVFLTLIVLSPIFLLVMLFILLDEGFAVFFTQKKWR